MAKEKKGKLDDGYISFTPEEIQAEAAKESPNAEAYKWLDKALYTSKHVTKNEKASKSVDIDNVYPTSAEESEQMRQYLDKAEEVAGNPQEPFFQSRLAELRAIVEWSTKRHFKFQWLLIAGVIVTFFFFKMMSEDSESAVAAAIAQQEVVDKWEKCDTMVVYETLEQPVEYSDRIKNANNYKVYKLSRIKVNLESYRNNVVKYTNAIDTASTKEIRKNCERWLKENKEDVKKYEKEYEELSEAKFKQVHKIAKADMKKTVKNRKGDARAMWFWMMFFLLLTPVYIFAQRPYGYTITRTRLESKILGGIQKVMFALSSGMALGALAMSFEPDTKVKWSDGTTTTETNSANYVILAMKICLIVAAVFVFCATSCALMIYLTVQGLRRNYNWDNVIAKSKDYTAEVAAKSKSYSEEIAAKVKKEEAPEVTEEAEEKKEE